MDAINVGYVDGIYLTDNNSNKKKVQEVYWVNAAGKVNLIYPAIIGYEEKTEYTEWVYTITISSGTRTRNWTSYKRAKYGNGTFGPWEETGSGVNNETGTRLTAEVNTSAWTYAITFATGYRTQTYQIRYTYTFSDTTQYIDSTVQTRRQDGTRTVVRVNYSGWTYNWTLPAAGSTRTRTYNEQANYSFIGDPAVYEYINPPVLTETESGNGIAAVKLKIINVSSWSLPANGSPVTANIAVDYMWGSIVIIPNGGASGVGATATNSGSVIEYSPGSLYISRINNTTTSNQQIQITITRPDLNTSDVYTFTQVPGVQIFGSPIMTGFSYPDIPAGGGTVGPNVYNWYQPWTWNGVAGSGGTVSDGGTAMYSNGSGVVSSGSKGTSLSGRNYIYTMTTRVDARGIQGVNAATDIYQAANSRWENSRYCSGYTLTVNYGYSSGATSSDSWSNSSSCGYIEPHFNLVAHLYTPWETVRRKINQDWVDLDFLVGDNENYTPISCNGEWNANVNEKTWDVGKYKFAMGGAAQSGGDDTFFWAVPAYVSVTNKSGGLAYFYWDVDLPSGGGATESIPLAAHYGY